MYWRLKIRALWLENRDVNTKYFQIYANHRKHVNTKCQMQKGEWIQERPFKELLIFG